MKSALSGETEIHDQPHDQNRRAKDRQQGDRNNWDHDPRNIVLRPSMSEAIQVRIVVVYFEIKVFLLLLSDRLLDFTRRRRSRRNSSRCCGRVCDWRGGRSLRKRA